METATMFIFSNIKEPIMAMLNGRLTIDVIKNAPVFWRTPDIT